MTIDVQYSCATCRLRRVHLDVPARGDESVLDWMDATVRLVGKDHRRRSPTCKAKELTEMLIPMTGTAKVGGPTVQ
jgi:hypothetical protein